MAVGEVTRLMMTIGADVRGAVRGIDQVDRRMQGFARATNTMMSLGGVGAAIGAVGVAVNKALDFGAAGANLINLERSFERFTSAAGASGDMLLEQMKAASGGMMDQAALMQQYNAAYLLMGDELASKMPEIIRIAKAASIAGMGDFQYLVDSLVKGLGRMSPLILDNLGFTVSLEDAYSAYARTLGKASSELTKAEQQQALLNAVMEQAQKKYGNLDKVTAEAAGGSIARLRAATKDYIDYLKTEATPWIDRAANAIAEMFILPFTPGTEEYWANILAEAQALATQQRGGWTAYQMRMSGLPDLEAQLRALAEAQDYTSMSAEQFSEFYTRATVISMDFARAVKETRQEQLHARNEQELMINTAARLTGEMRATGDAMNDMEGDAGALTRALSDLVGMSMDVASAMSAMRLRLNRVKRETEGGLFPGRDEYESGIMGTLAWFEDMQIAGYRVMRDINQKMADSQNKLASDTHTALGAAASAYDDYAQRVRSAIDSILQPTQSFDVTAQLDAMGLHQDTWDEKARRAMDVFNLGTDSPWAESLGLGSKEEAAQWIKDFYLGRMPEQIDWSAFDRALAEQMEKTANWERIQEMAYQRAADMGLDSAGVAGALGSMGIGGYLGQGAAMAGDLTEGFQAAATPQWMTAGS